MDLIRITLLFLCCTLSTLILSQEPARFERFQHGDHGLTGSYFYTLLEDRQGFIWVGGRTGLQRFDGTEFRSYNHKLSNTEVKSLFLDSKGNLWISTVHGLNALNPITEEITAYTSNPTDPMTISNNEVEPIYEDADGILWIGTEDGFNRFDPQTAVFTRYFYTPERAGFDDKYYAIEKDIRNPDFLWLGSYKGLRTFNKTTGEFINIPVPLNGEDIGQDQPQILGIHQDKLGRLYVGIGASNVIRRYHPDLKSWDTFSTNLDTRLSPHRRKGVYEFLPVTNDALWVSMVPAIGLFDPGTEQFSWIEMDFASDSTALPSACRHLFIDSKGHLWLPSLQGVSRSLTPVMQRTKPESVLAITEVLVNNRSLERAPVDLVQTVEIGSDQKEISVRFVLVNPSRRDGVQYSYRLLGSTNTWTETDTGIVSFSGLGQGSYLLELKGRESNRPWSSEIALPVEVQTVWWEAPWIRAGVLAALLLIIAAFMAIRRAHHRKEQRLKMTYERNLAEVQMEVLRAQMNPHFLFNTMNSINHYILKNDSDAASSYLTKFSRLIRLVLQNSKSNTVKLADELEALRLYVEIEQLRFEIDFELFIGNGVNLESIYVPPMILQPYVENAIWHGLMHKDDDRKLSIAVSLEGQLLQIVIKDNGIGRAEARKYQNSDGKKKSYGMQITRDRIGLVNHLYASQTEIEIIDVVDTHGNPGGTEIVLCMPVGEYHQH